MKESAGWLVRFVQWADERVARVRPDMDRNSALPDHPGL
jgi:hypothetical protein